MSPLYFSLLLTLLGAVGPILSGPAIICAISRSTAAPARTCCTFRRSMIPRVPTPVVLAFHGAGTNAAIMARYLRPQ